MRVLPRRLWIPAFAGMMVFAGAFAQDEPEDTPAWMREPAPEVVVVHDPAIAQAAKLQSPDEAFQALPRDSRGKPDWSRALANTAIQPRADVKGAAPMPSHDADVLMKNTAQMPFVKFPHRAHNEWLACGNCHDGLYAQKAGMATTTMADIFRGESCGFCHGKVAFSPMFTCERCHSVLQPGQKAWW